jgi:hypothetical protein
VGYSISAIRIIRHFSSARHKLKKLTAALAGIVKLLGWLKWML